MSKFTVDLRKMPVEPSGYAGAVPPPVVSSDNGIRGRRLRRTAWTAGVVIVLALLACCAAGLLYWQHLKTMPQYSLALLVDASRRGDKSTTDNLVDMNAVVDDFMPQITAKAIELYGRGLPPETIQKIANLARPLMPAVNDRARSELPNVIRERTGALQNVPFIAMVVGADRYLDIRIDGDMAQVISRSQDHPFEIRMKRQGDRWRIVGIKDDRLAAAIAQKIGQQIVAAVARNSGTNGGETLGIQNLGNILKQAEDIFGDQQ